MARRASGRLLARPAAAAPTAPAEPGMPEWRDFVGRWLGHVGCTVSPAARGDWEVTFAPALAARWRRRRVRLVFDPQRVSLPRGAWFCAPGSAAGQRLLEAAREGPALARRTALPRVPGAPPEGFAAACRVRGLRWGEPRLGPVRYRPRIAFHVAVTLWGGLPQHEHWTVLVESDGELVEVGEGLELDGVRGREGTPADFEGVPAEARSSLWEGARTHLEGVLAEREAAWERGIARHRDTELGRLRAFFATRIAEEEERARRRQVGGEDTSVNGADARSLKLEWDRRSGEVRARWAVRAEARVWGVTDWAWPVARLEQELRAGAVHLKLAGEVDVARGRPQLPRCPACGRAAEMLVRRRGGVRCVACPA